MENLISPFLMEKLDFILLDGSAERVSLSEELLCFQGSGQKTLLIVCLSSSRFGGGGSSQLQCESECKKEATTNNQSKLEK